MQLSEAKVFELIGRVYAENRGLMEQIASLNERNDGLVQRIREMDAEVIRLKTALDEKPAPFPPELKAT